MHFRRMVLANFPRTHHRHRLRPMLAIHPCSPSWSDLRPAWWPERRSASFTGDLVLPRATALVRFDLSPYGTILQRTSSDPQKGASSGQVLPTEDLRYRGVLEHRVNGVGD